MDKLSVHHQGKGSSSSSSSSSSLSSKHGKSKKKGIKVVYISNPMKVRSSASEFRALVQELTGQDSTYEDALKYVVDDDDNDDQSPRVVPNPPTNASPSQEAPSRVDPYSEAIRSLDSTFQHQFDEPFTPCLIDNYNALTPSTGLLYNYGHNP